MQDLLTSWFPNSIYDLPFVEIEIKNALDPTVAAIRTYYNLDENAYISYADMCLVEGFMEAMDELLSDIWRDFRGTIAPYDACQQVWNAYINNGPDMWTWRPNQ